MKRTTRKWAVLVLFASVWFSALTGCNRDVRLAGKKVRGVTVGTVTHYGATLDMDATPTEVVYVLLRAIRDDFLASTPDQRETALDKQFDICAADVIQSRNNTGSARDEFVHNVVYRWTPTVSHYAHDFETEWEKARPRLVRRVPKPDRGGSNEFEKVEVLMEVDDPNGDPDARVVMIVWLAKDNGYWRVVHLGFDRETRSIMGLVHETKDGE